MTGAARRESRWKPQWRLLATALLLVTALLMCACDGESVGYRVDGTAPDGSTVSCWIQGEQAVIASGNGPGFAYSLDRLPDGRYLLGAAQGSPGNLDTRLYLLDGDRLALESSTPVPSELVIARYDAGSDRVIAVTEQEGAVDLHLFGIGADGVLVAEGSHPVCVDCTPSWSLPAAGEQALAVSVRHFNPDEVQVYLLDRAAPGALTPGGTVPGTRPTLATGAGGFVLVYRAADGHLATMLVDLAGQLEPAFDLGITPLGGHAAINVLDNQIDAVCHAVQPAFWGALYFYCMQLNVEGGLVARVPCGESVEAAEREYWLSVSNDMLAVTWGEVDGADRIGAHLFTATTLGFSHRCGPERISGPVSARTSPHPIRSVVAPHPTGFAVVWGTGLGDETDGLHGKIIQVVQ